MYSAKAHFWLAGLTKEHEAVLRNITPLERFSHDFSPLHSPEELHKDFVPGIIGVVIADETAGFSPQMLRAAAGEGKIVYCTAKPENLSEDMLEAVDFLWSKPLSPVTLRFYFQQLLKYLKQEKDLWLAETYLDNTIDPVPDLIWYKDAHGAHLKVNNAFCEVVGKTKAEIAGRGHCFIWGLSPEEYAQGEYVCMETEEEVIQKGTTCLFDEQVKAPEGMRLLRTYKTPIRDVDGTIIGTVGMARNVTKEREFQQKILEMARQDALTGLANRRYLESYIEEQLEKGDVTQQTFIYFDLDHFKQINDTYGHAMGDKVLVHVASCMKSSFSDAFLVRLGGDEFLAVLMKKISREEIMNRVKSFVRDLKKDFKNHPNMQILSISAGIIVSDGQEAMDDLLRKSDLALYAAKNSGRSCCRFYDSSMEKQ
ncbi:MAG: GGDEF domain-containing protein [Anaerovibrio sp.]|uniref:sensor domain-containing diguanylate cyclase n=1 Tax=Anaerovibrio sp. TaxID=1872532 RepID=UPI0025FACA98|nr:GGDEF domain-containing protein [Anaerovibrio sp.]MCR5177094.1 GGDEF domain-containing protein [Anaerovibrio sp.]